MVVGWDKSRYENKRAELWSKGAEWLANGANIVNEVAKAGDPTLAGELMAPKARVGYEKVVCIERKKDMHSRGVASPDGADALMVTFDLPDPDEDWGTALGCFVAPGEYDGGFTAPGLAETAATNFVAPMEMH